MEKTDTKKSWKPEDLYKKGTPLHSQIDIWQEAQKN